MLALLTILIPMLTTATPTVISVIQQLRVQGVDVDALIAQSGIQFSDNERVLLAHLASIPPA